MATKKQTVDPLVELIVGAIPGAEVVPAKGSDYVRLRVANRTVAWLSPRDKRGEHLLRVDHIPAEALVVHAPAIIKRKLSTQGSRGLIVASEDNFTAVTSYLRWAANKVQSRRSSAVAA